MGWTLILQHYLYKYNHFTAALVLNSNLKGLCLFLFGKAILSSSHVEITEASAGLLAPFLSGRKRNHSRLFLPFSLPLTLYSKWMRNWIRDGPGVFQGPGLMRCFTLKLEQGSVKLVQPASNQVQKSGLLRKETGRVTRNRERVYWGTNKAIKESRLKQGGHFEALCRKKCSIKSNANPVFFLLFISIQKARMRSSVWGWHKGKVFAIT